MAWKIGVLALQGDFALHAESIRRTGSDSLEVRTVEELEGCDALVIPGGESTVLAKLLKETGLDEGVRRFSDKHPVMGTCAGLIVLSSKVMDHSIAPLGLIDITVVRNAYGRQMDSFISEVALVTDSSLGGFEGVFIRAPKITGMGKDIEVLAQRGDDVVMVRNKSVLVTAFHPELTMDSRIHTFFIDNF